MGDRLYERPAFPNDVLYYAGEWDFCRPDSSAALVMTSDGVTNEFLLNLMYYIIITPVITLTLTKIMYASENKLIVADSMSRIDSILEMRTSRSEAEHPKHPKDNSVELSEVSFRYKDADRNALNDISLTIKAGEHVAFVGPSGGGKTTLASIVARFWDVTGGGVKVGGVNVKDISKEELMDTVSFCFSGFQTPENLYPGKCADGKAGRFP